jgi:hypothetical protein
VVHRVIGNLIYFDGGGVITHIRVSIEKNADQPCAARAVISVSPSLKKRKHAKQKNEKSTRRRDSASRKRQNWSDAEFAALLRACVTLCLNDPRWPKEKGCTPRLIKETPTTLTFQWHK